MANPTSNPYLDRQQLNSFQNIINTVTRQQTFPEDIIGLYALYNEQSESYYAIKISESYIRFIRYFNDSGAVSSFFLLTPNKFQMISTRNDRTLIPTELDPIWNPQGYGKQIVITFIGDQDDFLDTITITTEGNRDISNYTGKQLIRIVPGSDVYVLLNGHFGFY